MFYPFIGIITPYKQYHIILFLYLIQNIRICCTPMRNLFYIRMVLAKKAGIFIVYSNNCIHFEQDRFQEQMKPQFPFHGMPEIPERMKMRTIYDFLIQTIGRIYCLHRTRRHKTVNMYYITSAILYVTDQCFGIVFILTNPLYIRGRQVFHGHNIHITCRHQSIQVITMSFNSTVKRQSLIPNNKNFHKSSNTIVRIGSNPLSSSIKAELTCNIE